MKFRLKSGLLYAGLRGIECALVAIDDALVFDERDNGEAKAKFYGLMLGCKFEVECAS
jgi:hypothetical protein